MKKGINMKPDLNKNGGFALLFVMLIISFSAIAASALFKYGQTARRYYSGDLDQRQAFWLAEAGIDEICAMSRIMPRPFGWGALPAPGETVERELDIGTSQGSYSAVVSVNSSSDNLYTIESTGIFNGHTNIITITAQLENFNKAVLCTVNAGNKVSFTSMDRIIGPMYMNGQIRIEEYAGYGLPIFKGAVNSTSNNVFFNYASKPDQTASFAQGAITPVFTEGIYLNSPQLDFTGKNTSDYVNDIKEAASSGGLTLTGDHTITLTATGKMVIQKAGSGNKPYTNSVSSVGNNTLFVNGKLTIQGVLDGELTIGAENVVTIGADGIKYQSAPSTADPELWTAAQIEAIDDVLGLITKKEVICEGTAPISLHGAYMSTGNGIYPKNRGIVCPKVNGEKPTMYLFGSIAEAVFAYTESGATQGFGTCWRYDPRFDNIVIKNFANRSYKFKNWVNKGCEK
jgi:hypothetical protein